MVKTSYMSIRRSIGKKFRLISIHRIKSGGFLEKSEKRMCPYTAGINRSESCDGGLEKAERVSFTSVNDELISYRVNQKKISGEVSIPFHIRMVVLTT